MKKHYIIVDTETSTLPILNKICATEEDRKKIAIMKPIIYDFGYTIVERDGTIVKKVNYLVAETFFNHDIFDIAYYANKRNIYEEKLISGELTAKPWETIMEQFLTDLQMCDACGAFNSAFDFKKAIPFTELYIKKLHSNNYDGWMDFQERACKFIISAPNKNTDSDYDAETFSFRGKDYPLFDLWGLSCKHLLNGKGYKNFCLREGLVTATGLNFKTSAESVYKYFAKDKDFEEAHTALDDAIIESFILGRITRRHKIEIGITAFPFKMLGSTVDYLCENPMKKGIENVTTAILEYLGEAEEETCTRYQKMLFHQLEILENIL